MITLPQHPDANRVLGEVATELGAQAVSAVPYMPLSGTTGAYLLEALGTTIRVDSPLSGAHQQRNVALAIAAAVTLAEQHGLSVPTAAIEEGIRRTYWPGRLERMTDNGVEWILDVAHNPAGAWALRAGIRSILEVLKPRVLIFSCLRDKPLSEMAEILFPLFEKVIVAPIHSARAAAVEDLLAVAKTTGTPAIAATSAREAQEAAQRYAAGGVVVVSGSVYLVGEVRRLLKERREPL